VSKFLSSVANTEFDSEVKQAYQYAGKLRGTVTVRSNVVGDTYKFRKMGKGLAKQRPAPSSDVTPMDIAHSQQTATLTNWYAPEYTDIFDAATVNFDEQRELARTIAGALGRRDDQLIIDAMEDGTPTNTVDEDVGGSDTGLNPDKVRRAARYMNQVGVPMTDRNMAITAIGLESLLGETEVTSSDYNTVKALVNGEINTWVGFKFLVIETRDEGGLPIDTGATPDETHGFAYHKDAIGYASGIEIRQETNYIPEKVSWLSNGILKAGSTVRDVDGYVEVQTVEV
jgi:hypothetical protein